TGGGADPEKGVCRYKRGEKESRQAVEQTQKLKIGHNSYTSRLKEIYVHLEQFPLICIDIADFCLSPLFISCFPCPHLRSYRLYTCTSTQMNVLVKATTVRK
ncbi:hypothetical protein IRJ41_012809, partial [Triplophysa rosa]